MRQDSVTRNLRMYFSEKHHKELFTNVKNCSQLFSFLPGSLSASFIAHRSVHTARPHFYGGLKELHYMQKNRWCIQLWIGHQAFTEDFILRCLALITSLFVLLCFYWSTAANRLCKLKKPTTYNKETKTKPVIRLYSKCSTVAISCAEIYFPAHLLVLNVFVHMRLTHKGVWCLHVCVFWLLIFFNLVSFWFSLIIFRFITPQNLFLMRPWRTVEWTESSQVLYEGLFVLRFLKDITFTYCSSAVNSFWGTFFSTRALPGHIFHTKLSSNSSCLSNCIICGIFIESPREIRTCLFLRLATSNKKLKLVLCYLLCIQ